MKEWELPVVGLRSAIPSPLAIVTAASFSPLLPCAWEIILLDARYHGSCSPQSFFNIPDHEAAMGGGGWGWNKEEKQKTEVAGTWLLWQSCSQQLPSQLCQEGAAASTTDATMFYPLSFLPFP